MTLYADSLAFLAPILKVRFADKDLSLDLAHVTVAPFAVTEEKGIYRWVSTVRWLFLLQRRRLKIVTTAQELQAPVTGPRHVTKILMGLQHPPLDRSIKRLAQRGVHITTIAYQAENAYGAGFAFPGKGLTARGEAFLQDLEESHVVLDLSHASHQTARDILAYRAKHAMKFSVAATHTGCYEVYKHCRNLPLDVLKGIADAGGYMGIYIVTFLLDPEDNTMSAFRRHLDYVLQHIDPAAVGIGSDGIYAKMTATENEQQYQRMAKTGVDTTVFKPRFPLEPVPYTSPHKMSMIADYLVKEGYPPATVDGVVGGNFYRFMIKALS